jgi:phage FluMu gp28-like protein
MTWVGAVLTAAAGRSAWRGTVGVMSEHIRNVTRARYEQIVSEARKPAAQITMAQFALGDEVLETSPMRPARHNPRPKW